MSNKTNQKINEEQMTYEEAVDTLKKSKKFNIAKIVFDSVITLASVAGAVYCVREEKYVAAGACAGVAAGGTYCIVKDSKDLKVVSDTLKMTNEQIKDDASDNK